LGAIAESEGPGSTLVIDHPVGIDDVEKEVAGRV
jgi:hypothetical protein